MTDAAHIEIRAAAAEVRAAAGRKVEGYAALFHTEARIADRWTETLVPGCFAASLASRETLLLKDHDPAAVLSRTRGGSLRLSENGKGLWFEAELPNTTAANDTLELVRAGLAGGCSFGFTVPKDGERWNGDRRALHAVTLHEISIVSAWPAFEGTSVTARARLRAAMCRQEASQAARRRQLGAL
jgi:HK97 family phage prohead protease